MSIRQATEPVPLADAVAGLLRLSDRLDVQLRLRLAAYRDGYDLGYAQAEADMEARWAAFAKPAARSLASGVGLMERRWSVHGEPRSRADFGKPHRLDRNPRQDGAA